MKKKLSELSKYGVKEEDLTAMEQDADKAIEMIKEAGAIYVPKCLPREVLYLAEIGSSFKSDIHNDKNMKSFTFWPCCRCRRRCRGICSGPC